MFRVTNLGESDAAAVKLFCLAQIKDEYGYDYNPDWHFDLDSLADTDGMYTLAKKGVFLTSVKGDEIAGTIGFRDLKTKPQNYSLFIQKFPEVQSVGSIWRTYTAKQHRARGIATALLAEVERQAVKFEYQAIYLHTSWHKPDSVKFWQNRGYQIFLEEANEDNTVHMCKSI